MRSPLFVSAVMMVGLVGCGGASDVERAQTLPQAVESSSAPATTAPLTKNAANKLLLETSDMPTGWAVEKGDSGDDSSAGVFKPARCSVMGGKGRTYTTLAEVTFAQGGMLGARLTEQIYRPKNSDPLDRLDEISSAMTNCDHYSVKSKDGTTKITLSALSFPKLGDGTLAVRGKVKTPLIDATDDAVYVAVGQQIVRFDSIAVGSALSGEELERVVRAGVERVQAAA